MSPSNPSHPLGHHRRTWATSVLLAALLLTASLLSGGTLVRAAVAPGPGNGQETEPGMERDERDPEADDLRSAQRQLVSGDLEKAIAALERLRLERPGDAAVRLWLGHAYRQAGDLRAATGEYLESVRLDPGDPDVHLALGEIQEAAGNLEAAAGAYRRVVELDPENPAGHRKLAGLELRMRRYGKSAARLERLVELRPDDADAWYLLGYTRHLHQDHDQAIEAFERALEIAPDDPKSHHGLGVILARRPGGHERALHHLRRGLELRTDEEIDGTAHFLIGKILAEGNDLEGARRALSRSIELDPERPEAHYQLARVAARLGDREAARKAQRRFQELQSVDRGADEDERRARTLENAVNAAIRSDDLAGAEARLQELLEVVGDDPAAWKLAVKVRFSAGDATGARRALARALELDPDDWETLYLKGLLDYRQGRLQQSRGALEASLREHPMFPDTYSILGNVHMAQGDASAAVESYRKAVAIDPDNPSYYLNLASAYREIGLEDRAEAAMADYRERLAGQDDRESPSD